MSHHDPDSRTEPDPSDLLKDDVPRRARRLYRRRACRLADYEPTERGLPPGPPSRIHSCPLDSRWRQWSFFALYAPDSPLRLPDAVREALTRRREQVASEWRVAVLDLNWEVAADDPSLAPLTSRAEAPSRYAAGLPSHVHAECTVAGRLVHIDAVAGRSYGPGSSFLEIRVHVDGRLAGVGSKGGCSLGFGAAWPRDAVALVDGERAVVVRDVRRGTRCDSASLRFAVELWQWSRSS